MRIDLAHLTIVLFFSLSIAFASLEANEKKNVPPPKEPNIFWGEPQNGLKAGLYQEGEKIAFVLENVGPAEIKVVRYHELQGRNGVYTPTFLDPSGKPVTPFEWEIEPYSGKVELGSKPTHFQELKAEERYEVDLSPIFRTRLPTHDRTLPIPPKPISDYLQIEAFGPLRFAMTQAGRYQLTVTYKTAVEGGWKGQLQTGTLQMSRGGGAQGTGRLADFAKKAAEGKNLKPLAATYFGTLARESFVAVSGLPDGTIVAFGNSFGPRFPQAQDLTVLGKGELFNVSPYLDGQPEFWIGNRRLNRTPEKQWTPAPIDERYPNRAGFIVRYSYDLKRIVNISKFDWGVGSIDTALVDSGGHILIGGTATQHFESVTKKAALVKTLEARDTPRMKPYAYQGVWLPGDCYVAKLAPDAKSVLWVWLLKGHRQVNRLWSDREGNLIFESDGLKRISADGQRLESIKLDFWHGGDRVKTMAVNSLDRALFRGGNSLTSTGREGWWRPELHYYAPDGRWQWALYNWAPNLVGHDAYRLLAPSRVVDATFNDTGKLWVVSRSTNINTVFEKDPFDLERPPPRDKFGMSFDGYTVGERETPKEFSHLMRIDPVSLKVECKVTFVSYAPERGGEKPNTTLIERVYPLSNGNLAFSGHAGAYLVQTPGALQVGLQWKDLPPAGAGNFAAVITPDFDDLLFSSVLPGCEVTGIAETKGGIAIVSRSVGIDEDHQSAPSIDPIQPKFGSGTYDGHILLIEKP